MIGRGRSTLGPALALAFGCSSSGPAPAPAPSPAAPAGIAPTLDAGRARACEPGELVGKTDCATPPTANDLDWLERTVSTLDATATRLREHVLTTTATELTTLHALPSWTRAAAHATEFQPAVPARLVEAEGKLVVLADAFTAAARRVQALHDQLAAIARTPAAHALEDVRQLVSSEILVVLPPLEAIVTSTIRDQMSPLVEPLVEEALLLNDHVCARPADAGTRAACKRHAELPDAIRYLTDVRLDARATVESSADELVTALRPFVDTHATIAMDRIRGRGPGPGEPCGAEDLCRGGYACVAHAVPAGHAAVRTCEAHCIEAAMQPCRAGAHCARVAGIAFAVCRP